MERCTLLSVYLPFIESFSAVFGQGCGVALCDLNCEDKKVVAANNLGTRIVEGDLCDNAITELLDQVGNGMKADLINHNIKLDRNKVISVILLPDVNDPQFALYIERDLSGISELESAFNSLMNKHALDTAAASDNGVNNPDNRVKDLLHTLIMEEINTLGIHPARLTLDEKVAMVHKLNEKGAMMIDGAIPEIARQLMISEPTVYRYLNRTLL